MMDRNERPSAPTNQHPTSSGPVPQTSFSSTFAAPSASAPASIFLPPPSPTTSSDNMTVHSGLAPSSSALFHQQALVDPSTTGRARSAAEIAAELHLSMRAIRKKEKSRQDNAASSTSAHRRARTLSGPTIGEHTAAASSSSAPVTAPASAACDRCRRLKTKCERRFKPGEPCSRCTKAGLECTIEDTLLLPGPPKRAQKELFSEYGVPYQSFRTALKEQRRQSQSTSGGRQARPILRPRGSPSAASASLPTNAGAFPWSTRDEDDSADSRSPSSTTSASVLQASPWQASAQDAGSSPEIPFLPPQSHAARAASPHRMGPPLMPSSSGSFFEEPQVQAPWMPPTTQLTSNALGIHNSEQQFSMLRTSSNPGGMPGLVYDSPVISERTTSPSPTMHTILPPAHLYALRPPTGFATALSAQQPSRIPKHPLPPPVTGQSSQYAFFMADDRLDSLFPRPEYKTGPSSEVTIGASLRFASGFDRTTGLFLDEMGAIQAAPTGRTEGAGSQSKLIRFFQTDWNTIGPGGRIVSLPWDKIEDTSRQMSIWPPLKLEEHEYDGLRIQASRMIAHPAVTRLVKQFFASAHHMFPFLYAPLLFDSLEHLLRFAHTGDSEGKTRVEIRQAQAVVLFICAIAGFVDPGAQVSFDGGRTSSTVALDHFAFQCYKLGWALAQPRHPGYAEDEITFDLSRILRAATLPLAVHRHVEPIVVHTCRVISNSSWLVQKLVSLYQDHPIELSEWKRTLADGYTASIHQRLWIDRSYDLPNKEALILLGPPHPIPGELRREGQGGASDRQCVEYWLRDYALHIIYERLLNSSLCEDIANDAAQDVTQELAAKRQAEADELHLELEDWMRVTQTVASIDEEAERVPGFRRTQQENMSARYWAFVLQARFHSVLDLIAASLGEVGAEAEELHHQLRQECIAESDHYKPEASDRVAAWISEMVFYRTEKWAISRT